MVTCKLSHKIESLGDDGVGSGVGVDMGSGGCVAVAVGGVDSSFVAQAVRMIIPINNVLNNFFNENI